MASEIVMLKEDSVPVSPVRYEHIGLPDYKDEGNSTVKEKGDGNMEIKYSSWDMFESIWKASHPNETMMRRCLQFCYLFPKDYEFHKDDMIQLWIAQGFFSQGFTSIDPLLEEEHYGNLFFNEFEQMHIFQWSLGGERFKLNNSIVDLLQNHDASDNTYFRIEDVKSYISETTLHISLRDSIDPITLDLLNLSKGLCTLLILHEHGSRLDQVPRHHFMKLPLLRALDLSWTNITELPSSVGNLKHLRYLNLSQTPLTNLPSSLCSLYRMQTLQLRGCVKLVGLPKGARKLTNLRHLGMDVSILLVSMPPGFGDLRLLQTLPAFVVGKENGCHITELKHMEKLCGTLRILRLENASSSEEAVEAALHEKTCLRKLELHWTELQDGHDLLKNLKPHTELQELQIVGYGGAKFPNWISDPLFSKLTSITIHDCIDCELLPPLGHLPSLKYLFISDMHAIETIDCQFFGRDMIVGIWERLIRNSAARLSRSDYIFKAFPKLEDLTLNGMPMLEKWSGIEKSDFLHLQQLNISACPKLTALPELSTLQSLQHLEISLCPLLESFRNDGLPASLLNLIIIDCPLLRKRYNKEKGRNWRKIAHIRNVWIDYIQISGVRCPREQKQIVINVRGNAKSRDKAMKIAFSVPGVMSANLGGAAMKQIVVKGDGFDPVDLTKLLRKKVSFTEIVSVTAISGAEREKEKQLDTKKVETRSNPLFAKGETKSDSMFIKEEETKKEIVMELRGKNCKSRTKAKAMKIVVGLPGVTSATYLRGVGSILIVVKGEDIDPYELTMLSEKKFGTNLVSVFGISRDEKIKEAI